MEYVSLILMMLEQIKDEATLQRIYKFVLRLYQRQS